MGNSISVPLESPLGLSVLVATQELAEKRIANMTRAAESVRSMLAQGEEFVEVRKIFDNAKRLTQFDKYKLTIMELYHGAEFLDSLDSAYQAMENNDRKLLDFCLGSIAFHGRPYANKFPIHK